MAEESRFAPPHSDDPQPENPFAHWLDDDEGHAPGPSLRDRDMHGRAGMRPGLLVAAAAPWLVVGWLLWQRPPAATGTAPEATPTTAAVADTAVAGAPPVQDAAPVPEGTVEPPETVGTTEGLLAAEPGPSPTPAGPDSAEAVEATAVLTVRTALGQPEQSGLRRYVDTAAVEQVQWLGPLAVVRVAVVVLEGDGQRWQSVTVARYAVPVGWDEAGAFALDEPWELPSQPEPARVLDWSEVADPGLVEAAAQSLATAGYHNVEVVSLARAAAAPGVLRTAFLAQATADGEPTEQTAWLTDASEPIVLGAGPSRGGP